MPTRLIKGQSNVGFTLIEVIVVVLLVSILSVVIVGRGGGSNARLVAETERLQSHLRYAQTLGLANNTVEWGIVITEGGYSLSVEKDDIARPVRLPGVETASYTFPDGIGVTAGTGTVIFDEWGSPGDSSITITLSDGAYSSSITIEAETGHQS